MASSDIPQTSVTLLKALASDSASARWHEFCQRYETPMRAFLAAHYPTVEADDVLQETLLALVKRLPDYRYTPDAHGHFRNYLLGILRNKAVDAIRARQRRHEVDVDPSTLPDPVYLPQEDDSWKQAALETAVEQLMANETIEPRTRTIFREVALLHRSPDDVARQYGVTRNNVDQIKARLTRRLAECVARMTDAL